MVEREYIATQNQGFYRSARSMLNEALEMDDPVAMNHREVARKALTWLMENSAKQAKIAEKTTADVLAGMAMKGQQIRWIDDHFQLNEPGEPNVGSRDINDLIRHL